MHRTSIYRWYEHRLKYTDAQRPSVKEMMAIELRVRREGYLDDELAYFDLMGFWYEEDPA
ncbi:MAG: hypothetical protein QXU06_00095 [Candidatus Bathyarchaeia archaeon]